MVLEIIKDAEQTAIMLVDFEDAFEEVFEEKAIGMVLAEGGGTPGTDKEGNRGVWVTVKGGPLFIKKGETAQSATARRENARGGGFFERRKARKEEKRGTKALEFRAKTIKKIDKIQKRSLQHASQFMGVNSPAFKARKIRIDRVTKAINKDSKDQGFWDNVDSKGWKSVFKDYVIKDVKGNPPSKEELAGMRKQRIGKRIKRIKKVTVAGVAIAPFAILSEKDK